MASESKKSPLAVKVKTESVACPKPECDYSVDAVINDDKWPEDQKRKFAKENLDRAFEMIQAHYNQSHLSHHVAEHTEHELAAYSEAPHHLNKYLGGDRMR